MRLDIRGLILLYTALSILFICCRNVIGAAIVFPFLFFTAVALGIACRTPKALLLIIPTAMLASIDPVIAIPIALPMLSTLFYCIESLRPVKDRRGALALLTTCAVLELNLGSANSLLTIFPALLIAASIYILDLHRELASRRLVIPLAIAYLALAALVCIALGYPYLASIPIAISIPVLHGAFLALAPELRLAKPIIKKPPREFQPYITAHIIMATVFTADFIAGLALDLAYGLSPLGIAGAVIASYGLVGMGYHLYRALFVRPEVKFKPLKSRWYTAWFIAREWAYRYLEKYAGKIRSLVEKAIVLENPLIYAAKHMMTSIIMLCLSPLPLALWLINPMIAVALCLAMVLGSFLLLATPFIVLPSKIGDRRRNVEDELPWFALYAASLQAAGIPLYECLKRLVGKKLLPAIEREARYVEKRIMVLGRDAITAMEEIAKEHPSRLFRDFVLGYTSILRTGGDLVSYLESRVREYLEWLSFRFRRYADTAVSIGEMLTALFTIFVSIFAIAGGIATESTPVITAFAYIGIPIIAIAMYGMINSIQPKFRYRIAVTHFIPAIAVAATGFYLYRCGYGFGWYSLSIVALVFGITYGIQYYWQIRVALAHEAALEDFLRDLTEMRKIGLPPSRAIQALARSRTYNRYFDGIVKSLDTMLRLNVPLGEAVLRIYTPSWLTRMVLFIVGEIEASGGGTVKVLENLTEFVSSYNLARREMRSRIRVYDLLAILTPVLLSFFVSISAAMQKVFAVQMANLQRTAGSIPGLGIEPSFFFKLSPEAIDIARVMAIESSIAFAMLASKTIDGTLKNTLRVVIVSILMLIYNIWLDPMVQAMVLSYFQSGS